MYKLSRLAIALVLLSALPAWAQRLQSEVPHDTALAPSSMMVITGCEAKDQDGAALPRAVSAEGDAVRCAATLSGIPYVMLVSEDGALTIYQIEDAVHSSGHAGIMALAVQNATHTTALSGTDGDYTPLAVDSTGKLGIRGTYTEDTGHSSGDLGLQHLCVRNDAGTALAGTDLDYIPCSTDSAGASWVRDRASFVDDSAFTAATSLVQAHGAMFDDTIPDSVDEGDIGIVRMSANRNMYTQIRDNAGNERGLNVDTNGEIGIGAIRTSVTPGTASGNLGKAEDAAHASGDTGVMALTVRQDTAAALALTDADYQPFITDSTGRLYVNTEMPDAAVLADNASNPTAPAVGAFMMCWDGTTWDRCSNVANAGDASSASILGVGLYNFNGSTWDRARNGVGNTGAGVTRVVNADNDPCQTSGRAKSSVVVNVTADAQLVALSGTTIIYVCGFNVSIAGTAPTMRLISGTGSVCATGLTGRTGAYAPLTGSMIASGGIGGTVLATAAGEALCMDVEGTSPSVQGVVTYVQQ